MQNELLLTTDLVEPRLRNDVWREFTRPFFEILLDADDQSTVLRGLVRACPIGALLTGPISFNGQRHRRDYRVIAQGGLDHYMVNLVVEGSQAGDYDGQTVVAEPGDIFIVDLARTYASASSPGSRMSVVLPRRYVDKVAGGRSLHGVVLEAGAPVTRLLADFIVSLSGVAAELDRADALAIEEAAIELLASGLARRSADGLACDPVLAPVLRRHVLAYIDAHLDNSALGPALLVRRFRISRAHLYRIFSADGGVATVVRERRLDAAYRELLRGQRSITSIGLGFGFSSSSEFSRAFRGRFGMTPSEVRREVHARNLADAPLSDLQGYFSAFAQRLRAT